VAVGGETSFELTRMVQGDRHTIVLSGELDMLAVPALEAAVRELCAQRVREIVLDLRGVTFMDSTGLKATAAAHQICRRNSCTFSVIPGPTQIQTLFELTGLAESVPFQDGGGRPGTQETILHQIFSRADPPADT
jgi:anti-sigma B factor antagonist